jgi:cation transport ATPase
MEQAHQEHQAQHDGHQMMRKHYMMLGVMFVVMLILMYVIMFAMIWSGAQFVQNINFFYMAILMATPMIFMMPLMMRSMYTHRTWNMVVYVGSVVLFILAFVGIRDQTLVGDKQFVRSMIPHHSGAILMCNRSSLRDAEVRDLCFKPDGIVKSQEREIEQMEAILERL